MDAMGLQARWGMAEVKDALTDYINELASSGEISRGRKHLLLGLLASFKREIIQNLFAQDVNRGLSKELAREQTAVTVWRAILTRAGITQDPSANRINNCFSLDGSVEAAQAA